MECINLQEQFGTRYRVTFDGAYNPKHVPRNKLDPWSMQLPCERGVVYPHGGDLLAVEVEGRRVTAPLSVTTFWTFRARTRHLGSAAVESGIFR